MGWRVWRLYSDLPAHARRESLGQLMLQSTFMDTRWRPGQTARACCEVKRLHHGIHAFAAREQALEYMQAAMRPGRYVFGEVSLWGHVFVHENGYRAECAYPKHIYVPKLYRGGRDIVNALRRLYGVEVEWTV